MKLHANGIQFNVVDEGAGPVILLLHGFPDSSRLWKHLVPVLTKQGYRVLTPDLRGFGDSDKPQDPELYGMQHLVKDVNSILDKLEVPRVHCVIGHDWGSAVAWQLAGRFPNRYQRLVALSVGHNACMFSLGGTRQREKSWYMLFFKFAGISEKALQRNDWALMRQFCFPRDQQVAAEYIADLSRPGALTAALNWYRANVRLDQFGDTQPRPAPLLECPVLGVWSTGDFGVLEAQMKGSERYVAKGQWQYRQIKDAGHWIPRDAPDELSKLVLDFLSSNTMSKL